MTINKHFAIGSVANREAGLVVIMDRATGNISLSGTVPVESLCY
jgi:hypothetical protein